VGIGFAAWLRMNLPMDSWQHILLLIGVYAGMFLAGAWALGVNASLIKEELNIVKKFIR
jgi:hypothetical protein